ncbi:MAG: hypothetical protein Q4C00_06785 [Bacillota bacterium]|nr:hypothetical protein [Bacillota bacterium]
MSEQRTSSYTGQCPFLMTRRNIKIKFVRKGDLAVPLENNCDYDEDCNYYSGCPVMEACKREAHLW